MNRNFNDDFELDCEKCMLIHDTSIDVMLKLVKANVSMKRLDNCKCTSELFIYQLSIYLIDLIEAYGFSDYSDEMITIRKLLIGMSDRNN